VRRLLVTGLLLVALAAACSSPSDETALADDLQEAGLWRGLSEPELATARDEVEAGGHPWGTPIDEKVLFFAHGPALADGALPLFLEELSGPLADLGVEYDPEAVAAEVDTSDPEAATVEPLALLNERLAGAGAEERFFILNAGDDDATVFLIDPDVVTIMQQAGFDGPDETPVEAT
jgi:hypothetical protein